MRAEVHPFALNGSVPLQQLVEGVAKIPLLTQPGTRWSYSVAVDVQGHIVEKLSGMPLADFMKTRIFDPLGMTDTGFYVPKEKVSRLALVHGEDATGKLTPPDDRGDPTLPPAGASAGFDTARPIHDPGSAATASSQSLS